MTSDLETQLQQLQTEAAAAITTADTLDALETLRVSYLGKKGQLSQILKGMGKLDASERPKIGGLANQVKEALQQGLEQKKSDLNQAAIAAQLTAETLDVTMPGTYVPQGHIHPLNSTIDKALDIFVGLGYTIAQGPEMETDYYNFEALNTPPDHPARDMQDTFYLPDGNLLRTHTSAVQIHYMEDHEPPIRIAAPGRCYRRDTEDATHAAVFHQIEILAVDKGLTFTDLKGTIKVFIEQMFGEVPIRFRASYFLLLNPLLRWMCSGRADGLRSWVAAWSIPMSSKTWAMIQRSILGLLQASGWSDLRWSFTRLMIFDGYIPVICVSCVNFRYGFSGLILD